MVAIVPIASLTTSLDSALSCSLGKVWRRNMPNSAPPNTQLNTIMLMVTELMVTVSSKKLDARRQNREDAVPLSEMPAIMLVAAVFPGLSKLCLPLYPTLLGVTPVG